MTYFFNKNVIFSISVFLFSLNMFSIRATLLSYVFMFLLMIAYWFEPIKVDYRKIYMFFVFFIVFNVFVLIASLMHGLYINYYVKFLLIQIYMVFILILYWKKVINVDSIEFSCKALILIHCFFFILQFITYQLTGDFLDFNNFIREVESESLYMTQALSDQIVKIRAVGLYSEPSFFAMSVLPPVAFILARKKINIYIFIGLISAVLSLSIASIVVSLLLVLFFIFSIKNYFFQKCFLLSLIVISSPIIYSVYDLRINQSVDYDAVEVRSAIFDEFRVRDNMSQIFGSGVFFDETKPIGRTNLNGYQTRDSSFFIYIYFILGYVGVAFLLFVFFVFYNAMPRAAFFLLPVLLFKYHILYGMLWFIFISFYILSDECLTVGVNDENG